jgi:D-amino peptidase
MKVYISVDMEGIAGVNHPDPTGSGHARYPAMVDLMVGETNAAIEGAIAAGAGEILVNDSHGSMYNLLPSAIHPRAQVLQGQKPWSMVAGAGPDAGFGVALFIGYHARAGHPSGTIAHTYTGAPVETRLAGRPTGEYGLNAAALATWGVPVGLVAGDDALAGEVAAWLPWAERVIVKTAFGTTAAASLHPSEACALIRTGAQRAVERAIGGEALLLQLDPPVVVEVDYRRGVEADFAALVPGAERIGDRTVRYVAPNGAAALAAFMTGNRVVSTLA